MPARPLLIYDGKCGFCRTWVDYCRQLTGSGLDYAASQDVAAEYPQIPPEAFHQAVQLVMPDGTVQAGAHPGFTTLDLAGVRWPIAMYHRPPGFAPVAEFAYRFVARHRSQFSWITRFTFGQPRALSYARIEWLFLRTLALIYFCAFASLAVQITGLVGEQGMLPA